ncbi:histidine--tRNA ligase [Candidatus Woesearchaeota archaeon]|nr:histidine--tRNA ligase [Candidatus Woesearchaeota archaeon]
MELERAKGTRDFLQAEKLTRNKIVNTIREGFELYGFYEIETPILEKYELLSAKYAGGAEILKETFKLKDQGNRELALRYDLTVPLARVIGMNPQLKMPFKRYQIGKVFRDGPMGSGRVREFFQCDADIVGTDSVLAEVELLNLVNYVYTKLGFKFKIKVNNRKILNEMIKNSGISEENAETVILTIDKLYKIGVGGVKKELLGKNINQSSISKIIQIISIKGNNEEKLSKLKKFISEESLKEISELLSYCKKNIEIDISLARGLSYYTGIIFEIVLKNNELICSIGGGGRYDNMIGSLLDNKRNYPAVGISFGLDRIYDALLKKEIKETLTKVLIIPIKEEKKAITLAEELRKNKIKTELEIKQRSISSSLDYASKMNIPFAIFLGKDEAKKKKIKIRDMNKGREKLVSIKEAIKILNNAKIIKR